MNANSIEQLRAAAGSRDARDARDDRMEQVRQLLVGDHVREVDARMSSIEQRLHDLDNSVARKLDTIGERIDALASQLDYDRRAAFTELSQGVLQLSERLRAVAKGNAI